MKHIYNEPHWRITWLTDAERFFKALHLIVPYGSILYFEGHKPARAFSLMLGNHRSSSSPYEVIEEAPPLSQHAAYTERFVADFVTFLFEKPGHDRFDHVHCYGNDGHMIFWFHDALSGGDLVVSRGVTRESIQAFCMELGPQYSFEGVIV